LLLKATDKGWGVAQAAEHLPSKHEALSSNSSIAKKKKKKAITYLSAHHFY
jgi:hypothetical protein